MSEFSTTEEKNVSELPLRLIGGFVCMLLGATISPRITYLSNQPDIVNILAIALLGFLVGLILTPIFTTRPLRCVRRRLSTMSSSQLAAVILGILMGLVTGGLFSIPLAFLPPPFRTILPLISVLLFSYFCVFILYYRQRDISNLLSNFAPFRSSSTPIESQSETGLPVIQATNETDNKRVILLDTSVIIDGRIADISKTGFLRDTILIQTFILRELQHIADSSDAIRRNRGRRGLEVLGMLQESSLAPIEITDIDVSEVRDADSKLVALARQIPCPILMSID